MSGKAEFLKGIRVLDLSMGWSGPLAGRHLADLGAEVIKVEACQHFDWWRGWEATPEMIAANQVEKAAAFNSMNRNKHGITLDLTREEGKDILKRLVQISDVLLENNALNVMPKLGLTYEELKQENESLIMLSMPAFGTTGPFAGHRAYGSTVEQASSLPHLTGFESDPPTMQHVAYGDSIAGLNAASALLTALWYKKRTGKGQNLDLAQVECLFPFASHGIIDQSMNGKAPLRNGNTHATRAPCGVFPALGEDEWITISVSSDDEWKALAGIIGGDADLSETERKAQEAEINKLVSAWTSSHDKREGMMILQAAGVSAGAAQTSRDLLTDRQLEARGMWQYLDREHVGLTPNGSAPYRFEEAPLAIQWPSPTLGQHGREVLSRLLQFTETELDQLEADEIIGTKATPR